MLRRWNNLRLRTRLVLSMALISALLTGAALAIIQLRVHGQMDRQIAQQVQVSLAAFQNFQSRSEALSESEAALVANVPSLEAAMSTDDSRTIEDPMADIASMLARGTILILADRGRHVVARYPGQGGLGAVHASALLAQSLGRGLSRTWWYGDGHLYQMFLHPIYRGNPSEGNLVGTLALGQEVDRALAVEISHLADGDVVFSYAGRPVVSSLDPAQEEAFAHSPLALATGLRSGVQLDGQSFAVDTERLSGAGEVPTLTVLRSFGPAQAFLHSLNRLILLVGLAALGIGAGLVFIIAGAFTHPLSELVTGVRALEQGDSSYPLTPGGEDEAGQLTAAFARMRTSLDQSQQRLLRAARMEALGQLAGGVAHDFNNLITVINGFSEIMLEKAAPQDPNRRYLQQIIQAGTRAAAVTRQLLVFSRKDAVQASPVEVNPIIANLHKMLGMLVGEGIELVLRAGSGLPHVRIDPTHLEQMVMNFAANARDAMPRGGILTIATENVGVPALPPRPAAADPVPPPGRYLQLSVGDTGTGMDAETQRHIFEPFYTTKDVGKGTGLGLATIYGIVKRSGGFISVESELGCGATFRVLLPASEIGQEAEADPIVDAPPPGAETILLVEDEDGLRAMAREALEACGYTVLEAANGVEALALASQPSIAIDLVFTDVVMPRMGGGELVAELSKLRPDLPVIFTSGYTEKAISDYGVRQGKVHFLVKPFAPAAMAHKIHDVLHGSAVAANAEADR